MNPGEVSFGEFRRLYLHADGSERVRLLNRRYPVYQEDSFRNFPEGWFDRFGLEFLEDLTNLSEVLGVGITVYRACESGGSLKVDMIGGDREEFRDLLGLYSVLSRLVCIDCGCIYGVRTSVDRRPRCRGHFADDYDACAYDSYLDVDGDAVVNGKSVADAMVGLSRTLGDRYLMARPIVDTAIAVRNVNFITGSIRREADALSRDGQGD